MGKTTLYCPQERSFIDGNFLVNVPVLPGSKTEGRKNFSGFEVDVLEVSGEYALVLLPPILARTQETALVNMAYLAD